MIISLFEAGTKIPVVFFFSLIIGLENSSSVLDLSSVLRCFLYRLGLVSFLGVSFATVNMVSSSLSFLYARAMSDRVLDGFPSQSRRHLDSILTSGSILFSPGVGLRAGLDDSPTFLKWNLLHGFSIQSDV